jgi:hypothetical protein
MKPAMQTHKAKKKKIFSGTKETTGCSLERWHWTFSNTRLDRYEHELRVHKNKPLICGRRNLLDVRSLHHYLGKERVN